MSSAICVLKVHFIFIFLYFQLLGIIEHHSIDAKCPVCRHDVSIDILHQPRLFLPGETSLFVYFVICLRPKHHTSLSITCYRQSIHSTFKQSPNPSTIQCANQKMRITHRRPALILHLPSSMNNHKFVGTTVHDM